MCPEQKALQTLAKSFLLVSVVFLYNMTTVFYLLPTCVIFFLNHYSFSHPILLYCLENCCESLVSDVHLKVLHLLPAHAQASGMFLAFCCVNTVSFHHLDIETFSSSFAQKFLLFLTHLSCSKRSLEHLWFQKYGLIVGPILTSHRPCSLRIQVEES